MISIVICTYNDSQYLPRAIESCLIQNVDKEIIVVDDCSTIPIIPEAMELIRNNKIQLIRHLENRGLSAARNTGIAVSCNDLIIPLDSDDFFFPRSLSGLVEVLSPEFDIYYGLMTCSGRVVKPYIGNINRDVLLKENPIFSSSLFKKEVWKKVGGYKVRTGPHYEDWNFWCRCYMSGFKFKLVPVLVYEHTEREDSMLRTLGKDKKKYVEIATEELRAN
jgi:glycosyltransferase involved in cell wall biosynthesis